MAARSAPNLGAPAVVGAAETQKETKRSAVVHAADGSACESVGGAGAVHVVSQARAAEEGCAGVEDREMMVLSGGEAQGTTEVCEGATRMRGETLRSYLLGTSPAAKSESC
jgi:hypothetical protein